MYLSKLYSRFSKLVVKFTQEIDNSGQKIEPYHLDFEDKRYREKELVNLVRDALPQFALTPDEYKSLKESDSEGEMFRQAVKRLSTAKKERKGEYGELLLFLMLKSFYGADRFVTKLKLRSSRRDQIKGFDSAHFTVDEDKKLILWLGESKFYKDFSGALRDISEEIIAHTQSSYLKEEFSILAPNIECNNIGSSDLETVLEEYLDGTISLDKVPIKIPAFITYNANFVKNHESMCDDFISACTKDYIRKFKAINSKVFSFSKNIELFFIILTLNDIDMIKQQISVFEEVFS